MEYQRGKHTTLHRFTVPDSTRIRLLMKKAPRLRPLSRPKFSTRFLCQDSRKMDKIPDSSIHLTVTSPPYNVGKEYDEDLDLTEYLELLREVFSETYRLVVNGGRACVNIANVGRKPYIPYHKFVIDLMLGVGFLMRGEIIWNKGAGVGMSTA